MKSESGPHPTTQKLGRVHVRWKIGRDMAAIVDIERRADAEHAWSEADFKEVLARREIITLVATQCSTDKVIGYALYGLQPEWLSLVNIAVDPDWQRHGVGRLLVERVAGKLKVHDPKRRHIETCIREGNLTAIKFLAACGFRAVGINWEFFENPPEDGYLMRLERS